MRLIASPLFVLASIVGILSATTSYAKTPTPATTTIPRTSTPVGLAAAPSEAALLGGAELFWKDNSDNETAFRITIRVNGSPDHAATYEAAANTTSFLLPADAPHVCEPNRGPALFGSVVALTARGESAPDHFGLFAICGNAPVPTSTALVNGTQTPQRSGAPVGLPAAPSKLLFLGNQVLWQDNANDETGYRVTIEVGSGSDSHVATYDVPANITSIILPPSAPHVCTEAGNMLRIAVRAFSAAGESDIARYGLIVECQEPDIAPTAEIHLPSTGTGASADQSHSAAAWLVVMGSCLWLARRVRRTG